MREEDSYAFRELAVTSLPILSVDLSRFQDLPTLSHSQRKNEESSGIGL